MSVTYAKEKFSTAIRTLATNPGGIKQRVADAWIYSLNNIESKRDIPADLQHEFETTQSKVVSGTPVGDEGTIRAYVNSISEDDAVDAAKWIVDFAYRLEDL